jgi:hypothetical protein
MQVHARLDETKESQHPSSRDEDHGGIKNEEPTKARGLDEGANEAPRTDDGIKWPGVVGEIRVQHAAMASFKTSMP